VIVLAFDKDMRRHDDWENFANAGAKYERGAAWMTELTRTLSFRPNREAKPKIKASYSAFARHGIIVRRPSESW
jgi:hypothetical protein